MDRKQVPVVVLAVFVVLFVLLVLQTKALLPERVATHFAGDGTPNGWMMRDGYARFILLFGLGTALFPQLIGLAMGLLPAWTFNLPNRDYWLGPSQRHTTVAWLRGHLLWLSCIMIGLMGGMHWLTVMANITRDSRLDTARTLPLMVVFVAATVVWGVVLMVRFRKPKDA